MSLSVNETPCHEVWMTLEASGTVNREPEEVYHNCYLHDGHRGKCVCGYCEEGFVHLKGKGIIDNLNEEVLDRA